MKHLSQIKRTTVAADRACASERIIGFLRTRYPTKMAEHVAADIGISAAAVRKLEERGGAPSLAVFGRMIRAYGPDFLHAVFEWEWLDAASRTKRQALLEAEIATRRAELQQLGEARV